MHIAEACCLRQDDLRNDGQLWPNAGPRRSSFPVVAKQMNSLTKVVFSKTLKRRPEHTRHLKGDLVTEVRRIKNEPESRW